MTLVDFTASTPTLPPDGSRGVVLQSLSGDCLARVLPALKGALWLARTDPFEVVDWSVGESPAAPLAELDAAVQEQRDWAALIYPPDRPLFDAAVARFSSEGRAASPVDYRIIVRDGELLWLRQWLLERRSLASSGRQELVGLVRVVSEEKRLQWEIMRTSESERSRLGQEIHDDVCQILAGISYLTHVLHQRLLPQQPAEAAELESINREIQAGLERTRALAHGLLPAKSDFNTLPQAFRELSRQVATRFGIQLTVKLPARAPAVSREHLLHLYRIVQEASSNAFKHGRASQIEVSLDERPDVHVLTIEDNGPGLPAVAQRAEGVGLNVMRNRAELLGGHISFGNSPRGGAVVQVFLPRLSDQ